MEKKGQTSSDDGNETELPDTKMESNVTLVTKKRAKSPVWEFFGFEPDEDGLPEDKERPVCRICRRGVVCAYGNTSNMFNHLKAYHPKEYIICRDPDYKRKTNDDGNEPDVNLVKKEGARSPVWQYFGYRVNEHGAPQDRELPTCVLCKRDVVAAGASTSPLRQHLMRNHPEEYKTLNESKSTEENNMIDFEVPNARPNLSHSIEVSSPGVQSMLKSEEINRHSRKLLWKYFGYPPGDIEELDANRPCCLLCKKYVDTKKGDDSSLYDHLKQHHVKQYEKVKPKTLSDVLQSLSTSKCPVKSPAKPAVKSPSKSPVWMFFGHEQPQGAGAAMCLLCNETMAFTIEGNTSSLLSHLQEKHQAEYEICKEVIDQEDKTTADDQMETDEPLHSSDSTRPVESIEETTLLLKKNASSPVWKYYGFKPGRPTIGTKLIPTCLLCKKDIKSCGSTTNLIGHLSLKHPQAYKYCLQAGLKHTKRKRKRKKVPAETSAASVIEETTLLPCSKRRASSPVWKYYGFKPGTPMKGYELTPTCRLCMEDIKTCGNTTNLIGHIKSQHPQAYKECVQTGKMQYKHKENIDYESDASTSTDTSTHKLVKCDLCEKLLPEEEVVNHRDTAKSDQCFSEECDKLNFCRECFAIQHNAVLADDQHGNDTVVFQLSAVEEMDAVEEEGDESSTLSAEVKEELSDVEVKEEFRDVEGVVSNEEDEECVTISEDDSDTDEYYQPPASRNSKTDSLSNSEAAATSNISQASSVQQSQPKVPFVCHRCKKSLTDNETINNERAGAPTPKGEVDYDYCWDCFATLRQIGFTEEHYNVIEIEFNNQGTKTDESEVGVDKKYTFDTYQKTMKHGVFKNGLYHCKVCGKSYSKASTLQKHSELHRQKDKYLCSICSKEFTWESALLEHERRHAELLPQKCNVCGKTFASKYKLKRHKTVHTKEKSYKCVYCEKYFSDKSSMVHHMRTHTGKKMYRCRTCSESFVTHYQRVMHEKAEHMNFRDFVFCDICGKNFPYKSKLERHKRIHTGEKPYDCDFCEKSFVEKSKMLHHMSRMHTGEQLFPCKTCSESFMTHYQRVKHEKAIHEPL